jgi:hypothetical protein
MLIPNPADCPRSIVLIPRKPQLALFADDIEDIPRRVRQVGVAAFCAGVDIEVVETGGAEDGCWAVGAGPVGD